MNETIVQPEVSTPKKRRFRFGLRSLIGLVLVLGLVFGWLARMHRQVLEQEALVAELARDRIVVNSRYPNLLALVVTKLRGSRIVLPETPAMFEKWLSPEWFSRPVGFNAGHLREEMVPHAVERLQRLGEVGEVQFHGGTSDGLRLFYIGAIPYSRLGPERDQCTFKTYTASVATSK